MDIQIFDNGGKTTDRYCLIIDNRKVYTMTSDLLSSNGVRYLCEMIDLDREAAGRPIALEDLPEALRKEIEDNESNWFGKIYHP